MKTFREQIKGITVVFYQAYLKFVDMRDSETSFDRSELINR